MSNVRDPSDPTLTIAWDIMEAEKKTRDGNLRAILALEVGCADLVQTASPAALARKAEERSSAVYRYERKLCDPSRYIFERIA